MIPGKGSLKKEHKAPAVNGVSVLKTSIILGANASGKSNLIKAMAFGRFMVVKGFPAGQMLQPPCPTLRSHNTGSDDI